MCLHNLFEVPVEIAQNIIMLCVVVLIFFPTGIGDSFSKG